MIAKHFVVVRILQYIMRQCAKTNLVGLPATNGQNVLTREKKFDFSPEQKMDCWKNLDFNSNIEDIFMTRQETERLEQEKEEDENQSKQKKKRKRMKFE